MISINAACIAEVLTRTLGEQDFIDTLSTTLNEMIRTTEYGFRLQYKVFAHIVGTLELSGLSHQSAVEIGEDLTDKLFGFVSDYVEKVSSNFVEASLNDEGRTYPSFKIPEDIRIALHRAGIDVE